MAKSLEDLLELAKKRGPKKISVAVAQDKDVLSAIKNATESKIAEPILVGDKERILEIAKEIQFDLSGIEIINEKDGALACRHFSNNETSIRQ